MGTSDGATTADPDGWREALDALGGVRRLWHGCFRVGDRVEGRVGLRVGALGTVVRAWAENTHWEGFADLYDVEWDDGTRSGRLLRRGLSTAPADPVPPRPGR